MIFFTMKCLCILLISFSLLRASLSAAEYGKLVAAPGETVDLVIEDGDVFQVLAWAEKGVDLDSRLVVFHNGDAYAYHNTDSVLGRLSLSELIAIKQVGPCTLRLSTTVAQAYVTYKLTRASEIAQSSTPVNTVVIPTDANGDVEIILESSVDLVNWTAATPGQYSAATENRFFRIRAVDTGN